MVSDVPPPSLRRLAALAGHEGDEATARTLLHIEDGAVAAIALGALARMGRITAADLNGAIADPRPELRRRAAEEVAAIADQAPQAPELAGVSLLPLLDDADDTVVEVAAWACGEWLPSPTGTVDRLAELATSHDDALVREAAVAALGSIGDPAGLPAILQATEDKATVRRRAVLALAPFDGDEVDEALQRATTDRDWQVRQAAEDLLAPDPAAD